MLVSSGEGGNAELPVSLSPLVRRKLTFAWWAWQKCLMEILAALWTQWQYMGGSLSEALTALPS